MSEPLFTWSVGRRAKKEGFQGEIMKVGKWGTERGPEETHRVRRSEI